MFIIAPTIAFADHHNTNEEAVKNENRSEEDRARDEARKPLEVLNFYGVEPGMKIVDLATGSYYSTIFDNAVGKEGHLYAQTSQGGYDRNKEVIDKRYAELDNSTSTLR